MIVDAHQHFWDPAVAEYPWMTDEVASLRRRFSPEDLEPLLREHDVRGTVLVQARSSLDETRMLLEIASAAPFVLGVVGWIDLTSGIEHELAGLVGVRHQVHDEPDAQWLLREAVQRGIAAVGEAGLAFDLLVRARELPARSICSYAHVSSPLRSRRRSATLRRDSSSTTSRSRRCEPATSPPGRTGSRRSRSCRT